MRRDETDSQAASPATTQGVEPEALLLTVAHAISDAIVAADDSGDITMWTGGAEATFGWTAEEALGQPLTLLMPQASAVLHSAGFARVRAGGVPRLIDQGIVGVEGLHKDGTVFPVELTLTSGEHGGRRYFAAVMRDVSVRKASEAARQQALDELARSNEELQRFASVASHDLNEPLRIVEGYLQLLSRRYGDILDDTGQEFVGHAVHAVGRMQRLIDDILNYARVGAGGSGSRQDVDLAVVADEVLGLLAAAIDEAGADIVVGELPVVAGDASLLRQALQNLVANALKYRREDVAPRVAITARPADDGWTIDVEDNGLGVDPAVAASIFDMFGRGSGPARERAGSGIGLAIVKRAVDAHGGTVAALPRVDGTPGARFTFTLPARRAA